MPLAEGQVGRFDGHGAVEFTPVTSCLTVVIELTDEHNQPYSVAAHFSLGQVAGGYSSTELYEAIGEHISDGSTLHRCIIGGYVKDWAPEFLTDRPLIAADGTYTYSQGALMDLSRGTWPIAGALSTLLEGRGVEAGTDRFQEGDVQE